MFLFYLPWLLSTDNVLNYTVKVEFSMFRFLCLLSKGFQMVCDDMIGFQRSNDITMIVYNIFSHFHSFDKEQTPLYTIAHH